MVRRVAVSAERMLERLALSTLEAVSWWLSDDVG